MFEEWLSEGIGYVEVPQVDAVADEAVVEDTPHVVQYPVIIEKSLNGLTTQFSAEPNLAHEIQISVHFSFLTCKL